MKIEKRDLSLPATRVVNVATHVQLLIDEDTGMAEFYEVVARAEGREVVDRFTVDEYLMFEEEKVNDLIQSAARRVANGEGFQVGTHLN